ncbi:RhuM family protein [Treponema putidum]|uniref:Cell filamentation protein Fic n=1 Tax=Treponema putidum TaxID=221027 RepID=A0ABY5HWA5_9SPIR|nr:RhuM family protein [Treponema putidum]UTY29727.1 cell filamentation protein Fic [Treponema putidum]UTY32194.1 cell filamentation protein Fic [Treponema putidum]
MNELKELSFLMYTSKEENVSVNVVVKDETIWLTQKAMAELFGVGIPAISKHLKNIFDEGELDSFSTISILEIVQKEGNRNIKRDTEFFNLDAIISVGYRVNSQKAESEYDIFNKTQKIESDFDRELKKLTKEMSHER